MARGLTRVFAIGFVVLVAGCSSGNNMIGNVGNIFAPQVPPPTPEQEVAEDQKCQTDGYQLNTPAYQYCRGELAKQRAVAEVATTAQPVPPMTAHR
jgi:hypothetical protein